MSDKMICAECGTEGCDHPGVKIRARFPGHEECAEPDCIQRVWCADRPREKLVYCYMHHRHYFPPGAGDSLCGSAGSMSETPAGVTCTCCQALMTKLVHWILPGSKRIACGPTGRHTLGTGDQRAVTCALCEKAARHYYQSSGVAGCKCEGCALVTRRAEPPIHHWKLEPNPNVMTLLTTCGLELDKLPTTQRTVSSSKVTCLACQLRIQGSDADTDKQDGNPAQTREHLMEAFRHHPPSGDQSDRYEQLRTAGHATSLLIVKLCPASPEREQALLRLQESAMWANKAISLEQTTEQTTEQICSQSGIGPNGKRGLVCQLPYRHEGMHYSNGLSWGDGESQTNEVLKRLGLM